MEVTEKKMVRGSKDAIVSADRVRVPAEFRGYLGNQIVASIGSNGCLNLIPSRNEDIVLKNYVIDDPHMSDALEAVRAVNRQTADIELDSQGRLTIDAKLKRICKALAGTEAIMFVGMGWYVEAWPIEVYNKRYGVVDGDADEFDNLIASLKAKLGKN